MNCRTDNCPNPVPHLDELCETCRHGAEMTRALTTLCDQVAKIGPTLRYEDVIQVGPWGPGDAAGGAFYIPWAFDGTHPTPEGLQLARESWNRAVAGANPPLSCHQPDACGKGSFPYTTPGSDQVQTFVTVNGQRVLRWFCSESCYERKGMAISNQDLEAAGIAPNTPVRCSISSDGNTITKTIEAVQVSRAVEDRDCDAEGCCYCEYERGTCCYCDC